LVLTAEAGHAEAACTARRGPTGTHEHVQRSAALHRADRFDSIRFDSSIRSDPPLPCTYTAGSTCEYLEEPLGTPLAAAAPLPAAQAQDASYSGTRAWVYSGVVLGLPVGVSTRSTPRSRRRATYHSATPLAWALKGTRVRPLSADQSVKERLRALGP
jgi:hypothetical protein